MVQNIERSRQASFPASAPAANAVFYRTYSRRSAGPDATRETWGQMCDRTLEGLAKLGQLSEEEAALVGQMQQQLKAMPSGRWLWVGGTDWLEKSENFSGSYNCTSTNVIDWPAFGLMMDLAMMGCGTGAVLEHKYINLIPAVRNPLQIATQSDIGTVPAEQRQEKTEVSINGHDVYIRVGDSRSGWVSSYQTLLELSTDERFSGEVNVTVDLSHVRPAGEKLKGFGGVANPVRLPRLYQRCANILNKAQGRKLTSVECCLLIDEAAACVVAGNIRRCLPEDALVHTSNGLVPIKAVRVGDLVQTPIGFRRVVDKFDQGYQNVYELQTNATAPRATLNHRQAVLADAQGSFVWKQVSELTEGDRLVHSAQVLPGAVTHLPADDSETAQGLTIPKLTPLVAWLIGFTHGDGDVVQGQDTQGRDRHQPCGHVEWAMNDATPETTFRLQQKLSRALAEFGLTTSHGATQGEAIAKSRCSSVPFAAYIHRHIKQPATALVVPSFVLQGSVDVRAAYLAGLADSDGGSANRPPQLLTTVYGKFVRQVGAVLSSLGIAGRLSVVVPGEETWQPKYNLVIPALKGRYNALIAPHSVKGKLRQALKAHAFTVPANLMLEEYNYSDTQDAGIDDTSRVGSNYECYIAESEVDLPIPVTFKGLSSYDHVQTFDIEVEESHCFFCDGYLTHNSAGMRQFSSDDEQAAQAKENLWGQDADGNWRIDPERDVLRMANHTRVFHHKPTLEECQAAVRKQYYSGEGAIQWAGEAIARANIDLVRSPEEKSEFLKRYGQSPEAAQGYLQELANNLGAEPLNAYELKHRTERYGLNPCVTADTWVHTEHGARQVKDLIGVQHGTYINGELFSTTEAGFFHSGSKPVVNVTTQEGYELRLTENHKLLKVTSQTQKAQYSEWVEAGELQPGDRVLIHNHRGIQPWQGDGSEAEGWLLGNLIGDGCLLDNAENYAHQALLRYWGNSQRNMAEHAVALMQKADLYVGQGVVEHQQNGYLQISSAKLRQLADSYGIIRNQKTITPAVESTSYEFYRGFLRGLFDADGSVQGQLQKGVSIRLAQSNLALLKAAQRMLLRLGIASTVYQERRTAGERLLPNSQREPQLYNCKAQHELVVSNDNIQVFAALIGFTEEEKAQRLGLLMSSYRRTPNRDRFAVRISHIQPDGVEPVYDCTVPGPARFDANGFVAHNCGEIIGADFHCNLAEVHLNQLNPSNPDEQDAAFKAGALSVAALLNHRFNEPRYRRSREIDPIVGVSFTGLFDFFVHALGVEWLQWWEAGRPDTMSGLKFKQQERDYLIRWRDVVHATVWDYCDRHGIKRPNRCTTVQPAGTKSLLTGASSGWHPPKAQRFIRRITFGKSDPVAMACIDYGYSVVPAQSDKDDQGRLLDDPFDPRCTEWLVEIPTEVSWANLPGADQIDISQFSALAQFDFYSQVQQHYTTHNTSATIELREPEVEPLAAAIYEAIASDAGYMSAALLARFDDHQTFPRLPF
ncbi:MAG: ribonucleoside-triphosphate reductase, adenosylcobalamin-dependent, partial [Elainellaceae cyanobacterium]